MTDKVYIVRGLSATSDESWIVSIHSTLQGAEAVREEREKNEEDEYLVPSLRDMFAIAEYPLLT